MAEDAEISEAQKGKAPKIELVNLLKVVRDILDTNMLDMTRYVKDRAVRMKIVE